MPYYNRDPKKDHNFDNHPDGRPMHSEAPASEGEMHSYWHDTASLGSETGDMG